mmetsp:Transcript_30151/g.77408  ORF Transcript_30151/g.77408 Transcript_30151/m.77408 type:complete len:296 (-) Transcript_30151:232-1119(-)
MHRASRAAGMRWGGALPVLGSQAGEGAGVVEHTPAAAACGCLRSRPGVRASQAPRRRLASVLRRAGIVWRAALLSRHRRGLGPGLWQVSTLRPRLGASLRQRRRFRTFRAGLKLRRLLLPKAAQPHQEAAQCGPLAGLRIGHGHRLACGLVLRQLRRRGLPAAPHETQATPDPDRGLPGRLDQGWILGAVHLAAAVATVALGVMPLLVAATPRGATLRRSARASRALSPGNRVIISAVIITITITITAAGTIIVVAAILLILPLPLLIATSAQVVRVHVVVHQRQPLAAAGRSTG